MNYLFILCLLGVFYFYLVYFMSTWCILFLLGVFYVYLVYFISTWCILFLLGVFYFYLVYFISTWCILFLLGVFYFYLVYFISTWCILFLLGVYFFLLGEGECVHYRTLVALLGYNHPAIKDALNEDGALLSLINRPALSVFPSMDFPQRIHNSLESVAPRGLNKVCTLMCGTCANENVFKASFIRYMVMCLVTYIYKIHGTMSS